MTELFTVFLRLNFSNFRYSLNLFSKFFASFPHGTCALLVSDRYLSLGETYHLLWAAIPSNSTLRYCVVMPTRNKHEREFHPFYCPIPKDSDWTCGWQQTSRSQFGVLQCRYADWHGEIIPFHSPLLGESLLFYFPPLNNMLKFSG